MWLVTEIIEPEKKNIGFHRFFSIESSDIFEENIYQNLH